MSVRYVPDQVVVKLKPSVSPDGRTRDLVFSSLPSKSHVDHDFDAAGFAVFDLPPGSDVGAVIQRLETCDVVEFAEANVIDEGTRR